MPEEAQPALKEMFNAAQFRRIADLLADAHPSFDRKRFLALATDGLDELSLIQRVRRATEASHAALPKDFLQAVALLKHIAPQIQSGFVGIFLPDFIGQHGHQHFDASMDALKFLTPFSSAEFAIREFLQRDFARTLAVMERWSLDENEHVRRLASEGSRPRLPWSFRLDAVIRDPSLTRPILENLKADPSLYVRKSVANHLNDISKDHPELMLDWLNRWDLENPSSAWIARHASRSLIKAGHPRSFRLFGFTAKPAVKISGFAVTPTKLKLSGVLTFSFALKSLAAKPQKLAIDYIVHYRKKSGHLAPKVFKLKETTLAAGASIALTKRQRITNFTTRVHHAGRHEVEIMINGRIVAKKGFELLIPAQ
ncbi:MAG TPA: DNA alkylation repair protein [Lacunisphaera sp.]|jgi:3-methyladenine DNA glycosylase AlkC